MSSRHSATGKGKTSIFPTHFLALPLVNADSLPPLAKSVAAFQAATTQAAPLRPSEVRRREIARQREAGETGGGKEEDREWADEEGKLKILPQKAQRPPGTLHLTLGTMVLEDEAAVGRAVEVLRGLDYGEVLRGVRERRAAGEGGQGLPGELKGQGAMTESGSASAMDDGEEVASSLRTLARPVSPPATTTATRAGQSLVPSSISVTLRGLGTFPSSKKARVFYAVPQSQQGDEGTLQAFAEAVQKRFIDAGVLRDEGRPLTLHATVANLKYSKGMGGKGGGMKPVMQVDATEVLARFGGGGVREHGEFVWVENVCVDRVRICKMGAVKSEDPVMGMEYPAIRIRTDGGGEEGALAEVVFS